MLSQFAKNRILPKSRHRKIPSILMAFVACAVVEQTYIGSVALKAADKTQDVTCRLLDIKREPALPVNGSEDGNWIALQMGPQTSFHDVIPETGLYSTVQRKVVGSWPHGSKVHSFVERQPQDLSGLPNRRPELSTKDYVALVITLEHVEVWNLQPFERIAAVRRSGIPREREHEQPKIALNSEGSLLAVEDEVGHAGSTRYPKVRVYPIRGNPYGSTPQFEVEPMDSPRRQLPSVGHLEFIGKQRLLVSCYNSQNTESESFLYASDTGELVKAFPKNRNVIGSKNGQYFLTTVIQPENPYAEFAKESPVFTVNETLTCKEFASIQLENLPRAVAFHPTEPIIAIALGNTLKEFDFKRDTTVFETKAVDCKFAHVKYGLSTNRLYALEERSTGVDDDVECKLIAWEAGTRSPLSFPNENLWQLVDFDNLYFTDAEKNYVLKQSAYQSAHPFAVKDMQTGTSLHEPITFQASQKEVQYSADGAYLELESMRMHLQTKQLEVKQGNQSRVHNLFPWLEKVFATLSPNKAQWLVATYESHHDHLGQPEANSVLLIDAVSVNPVVSHARFRAHCGAFVSNKSYVLAGEDGIEIRDSSSGEVLHTDRRVLGQAITMAVSGNASRKILVGGASDFLWNPLVRYQSDQGWSSIIDGDTFDRFDMTHCSTVTCSAWNSDGTRFAIGHLDGSVGVYDSTTKQKTHQIDGVCGETFSIVFDPRGMFLLIASESGLGVAALDPAADQEAFAKQLEGDLHSSRMSKPNQNVTEEFVGLNGTLVPGLIRIEVGELHPNWESPGLKQRVSHRIVLPPPKNRPAIYRQPNVASMFGDILLFNDAPPVLVDDRNQTLIDFRSEAPTTPVRMASNLSADGKRLLVAKGLSGSQGEHVIELRLFDVDGKREICKCNVTCPTELGTVVPHPREDIALLRTFGGAYSLIDIKNGNQMGRFSMRGFNSENLSVCRSG